MGDVWMWRNVCCWICFEVARTAQDGGCLVGVLWGSGVEGGGWVIVWRNEGCCSESARMALVRSAVCEWTLIATFAIWDV